MYNFFFSLYVTLYSVWAATCYWQFSINKFKTLDKTNKINKIVQTKLFFVSLSVCLSAEMWTNSEYIAGAGGSGIKPCRTWTKKNSLAQTSTSQIRFNLSCESSWLTRRVRWDRRDDGGRVSKRNVKAPVLSLLTSESVINLIQGCPHFCVRIYLQMRNSPRSTKWKVNKW